MTLNPNWNTLTSTSVAQCLLSICDDAEFWVKERFKNERSKWGLACSKLLGCNSEQDRFWLHTCFVENRENARDKFNNPSHSFVDVGSPIATSTPTRHANVYCYCQKSYCSTDPTMVMCENCGEWYHLLCINLRLSDLPEGPYVSCPSCQTNISSSAVVPKILITKVPAIGEKIYSSRYHNVTQEDNAIDSLQLTQTELNRTTQFSREIPFSKITQQNHRAKNLLALSISDRLSDTKHQSFSMEIPFSELTTQPQFSEFSNISGPASFNLSKISKFADKSEQNVDGNGLKKDVQNEKKNMTYVIVALIYYYYRESQRPISTEFKRYLGKGDDF